MLGVRIKRAAVLAERQGRRTAFSSSVPAPDARVTGGADTILDRLSKRTASVYRSKLGCCRQHVKGGSDPGTYDRERITRYLEVIRCARQWTLGGVSFPLQASGLRTPSKGKLTPFPGVIGKR